jgi:hypothetical protein
VLEDPITNLTTGPKSLIEIVLKHKFKPPSYHHDKRTTVASAKPLSELRLSNNLVVDTEHVDCKQSQEILDECGLQQGFTYRFLEYGYPLNHTALLGSCKRQADALKCLKVYAKCLPPLSRQVLLAMVSSRQRFNKKICVEKPNETSSKVVELAQCMRNDKALWDKGAQAEVNAIVTPEAIVNHKTDNVAERLKQSCCSVARARKEFMESIMPGCKQYSSAASETIDSYLADTVGIICPDFEKLRNDCERLPKLTYAKQPNARHFIRPILNVVQTLA